MTEQWCHLCNEMHSDSGELPRKHLEKKIEYLLYLQKIDRENNAKIYKFYDELERMYNQLLGVQNQLQDKKLNEIYQQEVKERGVTFEPVHRVEQVRLLAFQTIEGGKGT